MNFSLLKALSIPEGVVTQISSGGKIIWSAIKEELKNLLPTATDTDRKTIFNGVGYITGKRLSSSGGISSSNATMCASGFIPASIDDVVYIKGLTPEKGVGSYVITYNSSNTKVKNQTLAQKTDGSDWSATGSFYTYENGVLTIPLTSTNFGTGFDAFRFSGRMDENTIVTVNEPIN